MASLGGAEALIGSLPADTKRVMTELLRYLVPFLRFGPVDNAKCENFAGFNITSTTASDTGEFTVAHGLGRAPYRVQTGVLNVHSSGMETPHLRVSRPADASRLYFKAEAGSTNRVFSIYVEG